MGHIDWPLLLVVVAATIGVAVIASAPALLRRDLVTAAQTVSYVLLVGSVTAALAMTLKNRYGFEDYGFDYGFDRTVNLVPGRGILDALSNVNTGLGTLNLVGNMVMFAPIGFFAMLTRRWRIGEVTVYAAGLSVVVEITQYSLGRAVDIDDVLLNTIGALVGAWAGLTVVAIIGRLRRRTASP